MIGTKVSFQQPHYGYLAPALMGVIVDKYIGLFTSKNEVASGKGGSFMVQTNFSISYYLIKGDDGKTYSIKCSDIQL
jgi:hypothetical protein